MIFFNNKNRGNEERKNRSFYRGFRNLVLLILIISILSGSTLTVNERKAEAFFSCNCIGILCYPWDPALSALAWTAWNAIFRALILRSITKHVNSEENWIVEKFFEKFFVRGLMEMTEHLSAMGMYQMLVLGSLLDAKNQLETQRLFWKLNAQAHKDYHPSDDFCWFGTNSRSLAATEDRGRYNRNYMSKRSLARQLGNMNAAAAQTDYSDYKARWRQFVVTYCDTRDNNWSLPISATVKGTGLDLACDHDGSGPGTVRGATDPRRANIDIDFTRLIDFPRTLNVNFDDPTLGVPATSDEEDVLAMSSNLYGNKVLTRHLSAAVLKNNASAQNLYTILRSVAAKRSVAENSFNAIVALKSSGTGNQASSAPVAQQVRQYMAALVKDLMPATATAAEIYEMIGENPSYYSQLEFLAKRIYQNPDFYANLYDSPANIERKSVAMKAIEMMLDRALLESELRQEMLNSVLLSGEMRQRFRGANKALQKVID